MQKCQSQVPAVIQCRFAASKAQHKLPDCLRSGLRPETLQPRIWAHLLACLSHVTLCNTAEIGLSGGMACLAMQALVSEVKAQLAQASSTPANLQRLVFRGRVLKDEQRLTAYSAPCCCCASQALLQLLLLLNGPCMHGAGCEELSLVGGLL